MRQGWNGAARALAVAALIGAAAGLSGCDRPPEPSASGSFAIERFFDGASRSEGAIETLLIWKRTFTAGFVGVEEDGGFHLDETFHFEEGDRLQDWRLKPLPDGRYAGTVRTAGEDGTMSPAVPVEGYRTATGAVLDYDGYAPGGGGLLLHFRHVMEAQGDGTVVNRVRISKFGIPIAGARVVFTRVAPAA